MPSGIKVLTVFGTRPEAIKMAPVVRALAKAEDIDARVCVTAQHRQMLDQVLELFEIVPDYDLDLMKPGQDLTDVTANVLGGLRPVLAETQPDLVLVHGDTSTTLAASLAAYYQRIPVGHVEAGLRTGNILSPWPEEVNRKVAGTIARLHFAPTDRSAANLVAENVPGDHVHVTGNTVIDALQEVVARIESDAELNADLSGRFNLDPERRLIRTAREVNDGKPGWVLAKVEAAIDQWLAEHPGKSISDATIACYGLAFKPDIDDLRESPALAIVKQLAKAHPGRVLAVEPNIRSLPTGTDGIILCADSEARAQGDIHILLVDHSEFRSQVRPEGVAIDTRNAWKAA